MKIGICQTDIVYLDKKSNLLAAKDYINKCVSEGAEIIFFPEMSMTGFTMDARNVCEDDNDCETLDTMAGYAREYGVALGFGYVRRKNDKFYNRYAVIDQSGRLVCDYSKIHPFSMAKEDKYYAKGDEICFCEINGVRICPFICYDLRFPEIFLGASEKADLIIVAANWNGSRNEHWRTLLRARAIENQLYVAGINRVGEDPQCKYVGNSMVISPKGDIMGDLSDTEGCMIVDIDTEEIENYRKEFPVIQDRRPEIYSTL